MTMPDRLAVRFNHPANASVLRHLGRGWTESRMPVSVSPERVEDPYYRLGTHPDLVKRLWKGLACGLPMDCRWVLYGRPVLVHPQSGIVFAFAGGTQTYALRLPERERGAAMDAGVARVHTYMDGSKLDLAEIGEEWVVGRWRSDEVRWCRAAYEFASEDR